jgi:6-phosphogluconolactonase (cycloisomerase 2 family)
MIGRLSGRCVPAGVEKAMGEARLSEGEVLLVAARGVGEDRGLWLWTQGAEGWQGRLADRVADLSSLAVHPTLPVVYGTGGEGAEGRIHGWGIGEGGAVRIADGPSGGTEPCHVAVDPGGRALVVCNYVSGRIGVQALRADGGFEGGLETLSLEGSGPEVDRQEAAHPHQAILADGRMWVIDLGADLVRRWRLDSEGQGAAMLVADGEHPVPPGTGPRHGVMLPGGRMAVSGELGETLICGSPVAGAWEVLRSTTLTGPGRARWERNYPGDVAVSEDGRTVYLANRSHGTVAAFDVSGDAPVLRAEIDTGVDWPQHLLLRGEHLLVAGWDSDRVAVLRLEAGLPVSADALFDCPAPGWLASLRLA